MSAMDKQVDFSLLERRMVLYNPVKTIAILMNGRSRMLIHFPYMDRTFWQEINEGWIIIYMDDILIFLNSLEQQECIQCILRRLHEEHLFLKPEKCTFDTSEVEYLGMIIRPGQVAMDPAKLAGINDWPVPSSVKETHSFLRFCNFYRHFISHYSDVAHPLIDLTKKDVIFSWSPACTHAFNKLKEVFISAPVHELLAVI